MLHLPVFLLFLVNWSTIEIGRGLRVSLGSSVVSNSYSNSALVYLVGEVLDFCDKRSGEAASELFDFRDNISWDVAAELFALGGHVLQKIVKRFLEGRAVLERGG